MKFLSYLKFFIVWSTLLMQIQPLLLSLGMPAVAFKNVGACFKPGFEMYAPMFGSMALSSGFIENIRFYNVIPGVDKEGNRRCVKDKAFKDDPIMEIMLILFPSPAGQLTVEGSAETNFGKLCTEADIATLFNFVCAIRKRLETKKAHLPKDLNKILKEISDPENKINILRNRFKNEKIKNIDKLLLTISKALEQERNHDRELSKVFSKEEDKQEESEIEGEKTKPIFKKPFYPKYMVEQIIGAFFCHKFAQQENLKNLLWALDDKIINKKNIQQIDQLLQKEDLDPALQNIKDNSLSLDDIWIGLHRTDFFSQILPYKNNQNPISNGLAKKYSRSHNILSNATFADCAEVTIRHIMNALFFDRESQKFSLKKLDALMNEEDQIYIKNLKAFYAYQTPDLANSGDSHIRSLWNKVVAELGGNISYRQKFDIQDAKNNNELETGMLNLIRVFERIFNFDLGNEPIFEIDKKNFTQQVQKRVFNCFKKLFEELSPQEVICDINYSDVKSFEINDTHDLSGNIAITINDKNSQKKLFSFVIQILGGSLNNHLDIQNIQINHKGEQPLNQNECESIAQNLNALSKSQYSSSFFLADELIKKYRKNLNPVYHIFCNILHDTNGKLRALSSCHNIFEHVDKIRIDHIIANIMKNYLWNDIHSINEISKAIFNKNEWENQLFLNMLKKYCKSIDINASNIEVLNISDFKVLKTLNINYCKNLKSLHGTSESIEELTLTNVNIETVDVSPFTMLKKLMFNYCENLKSLHGVSKSIEELTLTGVDIERLDISQFSVLKNLTLRECKNFKSLEGPSKRIEELSLFFLINIKILNISTFNSLKKLTIRGCNKLNSIIISEMLSEDQRQELEKNFPMKVKIVAND